ncbi:AAA family ATPase [Aureimonas glaciei]|uniref:AAA+ ATPase domain-containing protein n=1 Tax=Aureimonas glaciei TaxID=1776957 RepID=A0A917DFW0_9HYPH|nr:AAA family ATPase [Aureimonas glaciei]GGD34831.1 hypothetical protein GCM10011335_42360 [Aureimonas glaciei]
MAAPKQSGKLRKRQLDAGSGASALEIHYAIGEHPVAESVATLLLVEKALQQSGMVIGDLAARFDRPGSVVVLRAEVAGFAASALRLLEDGSILPGRTQTLDVGYVRPGGHVRFADDLDIRWRIVSMLCEPDGDDPEGESDSVLRTRIANVTRAGYPLLVIAEKMAIPALLSLAADQVLDAGALDVDMIAETAASITGDDQACIRSALVTASFDPAHLSVDDLSVAIRFGVPIDRMIETLTHLAATVDGGDGDGRAETWSGSRTASQDDRDWDRRPASLSTVNKGRKEKGRSDKGQSDKRKSGAGSVSGSAVILPDASTDPYRLSVETLAGYGDAKNWALDLKVDLDLWRTGSLAWDQLSSRLLLSGPPGTGKTTFARALCNSLDLPLHISSVSTWLEAGYLGSVISRMNAAFEEARANAPSILFIDECDGIGKRQSQDRDFADYWNALVNKMLELMDGAAKAEGVIIVGATNRPEAMDEALKRSGRWERQIAMPMPDREALTGILAHHLGPDLAAVVATGAALSKPTSPSSMPHRREEVGAVLTRLARQAVGLSGADVERLVREARAKARRDGRSLAYADLATGLAAGRPIRPRDLRWRMAIHEVGHALVRRALKVGTEVGLSIEAASGGYAESMLDVDVVQSEGWVSSLIAVCLAGRAAETLIFGDTTSGSGGSPTSDLANATRLALSMEIELGFGRSTPLLHRSMDGAELLLLRDDPLRDAVHARLEAALALATRTIEAERACLLRLAEALAEAGSMNAAEIAAVFAHAATDARQASAPDQPEPPV